MELTYEEREGLGAFRVGHKFGVDVSADETLEIYKKNFPAFVIHATTDAECDITLDATSPLGADFDAEYGTSSFRTVNETLFSFGVGGGSGVKRSEEIADKAAIGFPYLRLKFSADATVDFAFVCSASYSELKLAGDIDVTDRTARILGQLTDGTTEIVPAKTGQLPSALSAAGNLLAAISEDAVGLFKTTDFTEVRDITRVGGTSQTGADWTPLFQNLDIALSALRAEQRGFFEPKSNYNSSSAATLTVDLDTGLYGGRTNVEVWVKSSAAADFDVQGSTDGANWRTVDTLSLSAAGETHSGYSNAYRYIRVTTSAANDSEIEIAGSR